MDWSARKPGPPLDAIRDECVDAVPLVPRYGTKVPVAQVSDRTRRKGSCSNRCSPRSVRLGALLPGRRDDRPLALPFVVALAIAATAHGPQVHPGHRPYDEAEHHGAEHREPLTTFG